MSASSAQIGALPLQSIRALRWMEISLVVALGWAVLAFGGTEPSSFACVEVFLFGTAIVAVVTGHAFVPGRVATVPLLVVGFVLLQLCAIPTSLLNRGLPHAANGRRFATLTIESFATRSQLLTLVACVIAFFLAYAVGREPASRRRFVMWLVGFGLFEALYGLAQYLTGWQKILGYAKVYDLEEATGTYVNRNHFAGFLEMILPLALALAVYEWSKLRRRIAAARRIPSLAGDPGVHRVVLWLFAAVVILLALVYSRSRMGIASSCLVTVLVAALFGSSRSQRRAGVLICGVFLLASGGVVAWLGARSVVHRFQNSEQEYATGDRTRLSIWRDTCRLIRRHPWIGTGYGTFPIAFTSVQTTFLNEFVNHAHNDYLELSSDLGIPIAGVCFGSFIWVLARAVRAFHCAARSFDRFLAVGLAGSIAAILMHSVADFNLYIPANSLVFASILGMTLTQQPRESERA